MQACKGRQLTLAAVRWLVRRVPRRRTMRWRSRCIRSSLTTCLSPPHARSTQARPLLQHVAQCCNTLPCASHVASALPGHVASRCLGCHATQSCSLHCKCCAVLQHAATQRNTPPFRTPQPAPAAHVVIVCRFVRRSGGSRWHGGGRCRCYSCSGRPARPGEPGPV